jgi:hypothetical protein
MLPVSKAIKLLTKIKSMDDVQKSLQELEKRLNELSESVNPVAGEETNDTKGKPGDIKITKGADNSYTFEVKTEEGWKTPVIGSSAITFKDKPAAIKAPKKESIDEIESADSTTGDVKAKKVIFDEKADKFILARPDYDSGWLEDASNDAAITIEHNLEVTHFSNVSFYASFSSTGLYACNASFGHLNTAGSNKLGYYTQIIDLNTIKVGTGEDGPPKFNCAGLENDNVSFTHFRLLLWK